MTRPWNEGYDSPMDTVEKFELKPSKVLSGEFCKINEVVSCIQNYCNHENVSEAFEVTKKYMLLSEIEEQKVLFKTLFEGISDCISKDSCSFSNDFCEEIMRESRRLFQDYELCDENLCSLLISEYLKSSKLTEYACDIFDLCREKEIPILGEVLSAFINSINPMDTPLEIVINVLHYTKNVCSIAPPKSLLSTVMQRFSRDCGSTLTPPFFQFCTILCGVTQRDAGSCDQGILSELQEFCEFCINKKYWEQIAGFFLAWAGQGCLLNCICQALAANLEDVGVSYETIVAEIYEGEDDLPSFLGGILGQMGVLLMLEAYVNDQLLSAYHVLHTLHKYNFNYCEMQVHGGDLYIKELSGPINIVVFSFTIAFIAMEICLQVERPKDGYRVFQCSSLAVPTDSEVCLKYKIKQNRLQYLLKFIEALQHSDPFYVGVEAFQTLLLTFEQDSESLKEFSNDISAVYNEYLIILLNQEKVYLLLEFYSCSKGHCKEALSIQPHVLRGLVVLFSKNGMVEEAKKIFLVGYTANIYKITNPIQDKLPRKMQVFTYWTYPEIKMAIEQFISDLFRVLTKKPKKADFEKWYTLKIFFQLERKENFRKINCLEEESNSFEESIKRTCSVLKAMQKGSVEMAWEVEGDRRLIISANSIYAYATQKYSTLETVGISKGYTVPKNVPAAFGKVTRPVNGSEKEFCSSWSSNNSTDIPLSLKKEMASGSSCNTSPQTPKVRSINKDSSMGVTSKTVSTMFSCAGDRKVNMPSTPLLNNDGAPGCSLAEQFLKGISKYLGEVDSPTCNNISEANSQVQNPKYVPQKKAGLSRAARRKLKTQEFILKRQARTARNKSLRKISQGYSQICNSILETKNQVRNPKSVPEKKTGVSRIVQNKLKSQQLILTKKTSTPNSVSLIKHSPKLPPACNSSFGTSSLAKSSIVLPQEKILVNRNNLKTKELIFKKMAQTPSNRSSIEDSPELSGLTVPSKSKLTLQKLATVKIESSEHNKPFLSTTTKPSYFPLSTPSKYFKLVRPVTPILKESLVRSKRIKASLQKSTKLLSNPKRTCLKKEVSITAGSTECKLGENTEDSSTPSITDSRARSPSTIGMEDLDNFKISFQTNSSERKVISSTLQNTSEPDSSSLTDEDAEETMSCEISSSERNAISSTLQNSSEPDSSTFTDEDTVETMSPHITSSENESADRSVLKFPKSGGLALINENTCRTKNLVNENAGSPASCSIKPSPTSSIMSSSSKLEQITLNKLTNPSRTPHRQTKIPLTVKDTPQKSPSVTKNEPGNCSKKIKLNRSTSSPKSNYVSDVSAQELKKIVLFLKTKLNLQSKKLKPDDQELWALKLAANFAQEYNVKELNKKNMKLLNEFAHRHI